MGGASSEEGEYLQEPLRCVGIHAGEAVCSVAANEPLVFPQPVAIYKAHSGVMHSLQVSEQGLKPRMFDTLAPLTAPPFLTSSICTSGTATEWLSEYQHAAREGDENWGSPGMQAFLESKGKADWTGLAAAGSHPCPTPQNFPVDTPLPSVQPLLSKHSCDTEWPWVGLGVLMMTVWLCVLNKAVSAA